jgi:hypothetical protein
MTEEEFQAKWNRPTRFGRLLSKACFKIPFPAYLNLIPPGVGPSPSGVEDPVSQGLSLLFFLMLLPNILLGLLDLMIFLALTPVWLISDSHIMLDTIVRRAAYRRRSPLPETPRHFWELPELPWTHETLFPFALASFLLGLIAP